MAVIVNTGYYNASEIKNCVDAGKSVYRKKGKSNNQQRKTNTKKLNLSMIRSEMCILVQKEKNNVFWKMPQKKEGLKYRKYII